MAKRYMVSFEVEKQEQKLIEQRAKQEGVSRSQYIREAVFLEFFLSGDLEALQFLAGKAQAAVAETLGARFGELRKLAAKDGG